MNRLRYWWGRVRCAIGRHDWRNDGLVVYADGYTGTERVVQRCDRDGCWCVRFL